MAQDLEITPVTGEASDSDNDELTSVLEAENEDSEPHASRNEQIEHLDNDSWSERQDTETGDTQPLLANARFASRDLLRPWFPQADPDLRPALKGRNWLSSRQSLLITACAVAWLVFVINLIAVAYLPAHYSDARLFTGKCTTANRLDSGLHVLINLLSSLLLGASNLCVQLLSAPTRQEVDRAHKQKIWLDIGIPSVLRNLKHIALRRKVAVVILAMASLPLHFL